MKKLPRIAASLFALTLPAFAEDAPKPETSPKRDDVKLWFPGKDWFLQLGFDGPDRTVTPYVTQGALAWKMKIYEAEGGFIVTAFAFKALEKGDSKACREYNWRHVQKVAFRRESVERSEKGEVARLDYVHPIGNQKNVWLHVAKDDIWIDVHISKVQFQPETDQKTLEALVERFQIVAGTPDAMTLWLWGSSLYNNRDYAHAIAYYEKALEAERKKPSLKKEFWFVLVDNLGMAYGISGDLPRAKKTFEYGLSKEKTYPMFYYNLACAYAEMGDLDHSLENLRTAFRYKANVVKGESMPNPETDDSFKKYLGNEKFKALLKEIPR